MVSYTSAAAQIATAIKATLDTFSITRVDQNPTIRSMKRLKLELCTMAAAIESAKTGGKFGHMYVILTEEEYRKATGNKTATVTMLTKPPDVNPKFKTVKKEDLTRFVSMELEAETKMEMTAYITQEEVSKEIARRMVESIDIEFIEELKNEYTGFANETPKTFITHMEKEYCESTIDDQLKALKEFEVPWDQVTPFGTWITRLGREKDKCAEAGVNIDDERMKLTIASNAMKCALFTQQDHEGYNDLTTKDLASVKAYWVKKYKAHKKFNRDQSATNEYESAAYTTEPPPPHCTSRNRHLRLSAGGHHRPANGGQGGRVNNQHHHSNAGNEHCGPRGGSQAFDNLGSHIDGNQWRWRRRRRRRRKASRAARKRQGWKPITKMS